MKLLLMVLSLASLYGCASQLQVVDSNNNTKDGIPVNSPRLVNIKTTTTYEVRPEYKGRPEEKLCAQQKITYSHKVLPLGERHYIGFKSATLGKSEFSLSFSDTGILTGVTLNSDPTEAISKATELLTTALPYIAAPKPVPEVEEKAIRDTKPQIEADKERSFYCLTKEIKEEILDPVKK